MKNVSFEHPIEVKNLRKEFSTGVFKRKLAVDDLSFKLPRGKMVGLLGPNGSGKSTTLKIILGFLRPTVGEVSICGHSPNTAGTRRHIGYLPENPRFQKFLTASEALMYLGTLLGSAGKELRFRVDEVLEWVQLTAVSKERVKGFSKGMVQRLAIAQSLFAKPPILIFDEPMSGLDPVGRMEIRKLVGRIHSELPNTLIFFSSHVLEDVEELCEEVILLRKGRLQRQGSVQEILAQDSRSYDITIRNEWMGLIKDRGVEVRKTPIGYTFTVPTAQDLAKECSFLAENGASIVSVSTPRHRLEKALFEGEMGREG